MAWSSPQLEEGSCPRVPSATAQGTRRTALSPLQKSLGDIRHQCLWWSLSGFAQHVSAIYLPLANVLQRDVLSLRKALLRSRLERPAAWRWTFLGTEMGIQQTSETQHTIVHCTTTNPSPSSRFLVSLGFLASLQPQFSNKTYQSRIISTIKPIAYKCSYVPPGP